MNLLSIRQKFIELSGRYDLATTTDDSYDTDNGADFFISAGMRFLDREFLIKKSKSTYFTSVRAGDFYVTFRDCMTIEEIWANDDSSRWRVKKYPEEDLRIVYTGLVSETDGGAPLFYHPINLRAASGSEGYDDLGEFFSYIEQGDVGSYNGVLFLPKVDGEYLIEVIGRFYTPEMTGNTDQNYWTNVAPDTLLKAALYQLEVFYRNTEGAKDWLGAIRLEGTQLEMNLVEEESNDSEVLDARIGY